VLFPQLNTVLVERVFATGGVVHVVARTQDRSWLCPSCRVPSRRVHSCYERRLADTPVVDQLVLIELTVRRLYCDNAHCQRRTFVEQVPGLTFRYGRRTSASRRVLEAVAVALAGRAGARLAVLLHSVVSRMTLLRLVMALPDPAWTLPKVLGVSGLIGQMITAGLVARGVDPTDRRASVVTLTDAGRNQLTAWTRAHERRLDIALFALDDSDRDAVRAALPALFRLAENLDTTDGQGPA
jgi:hypothetical protein